MSNRMKLEVDPSIIEKNLDFRVDNPEDDPLSRLFPSSEREDDNIPWKLVRPKPGFVVKYRTLEGDKVFVNVCHCTEVPEPRDITDKELNELVETDEPSTFTIPMSIGELHVEYDKSNNLASAYDVAINSKFFDKLQDNIIFKNFFISVITEGIENKHKLELDKESQIVILKNKKCVGTIEPHRIQQRPIRTAAQLSEKKLIQELPGQDTSSKPQKQLIQELQSVPSEESSSNSSERSPAEEFGNVKLIKTPKEGPAENLIALITISALSGKELELDVGEDRIMVSSPRKNEMVDFFLPYKVDRDKVSAKYLVNAQTLRVELPIT